MGSRHAYVIQAPLAEAANGRAVMVKPTILLEAARRKINEALYSSVSRILLKDHYFLYSDYRIIVRLGLFECLSGILGDRNVAATKRRIVDQAVMDFMKAVPFNKRNSHR